MEFIMIGDMAFTLPPIRPNWHVILIHYPLALLSLGLLIEFFSLFWRRSAFRTAGRWMLLLGSLLGIVAITTGLYAMIRMVGGDDSMTWAQHAAQSPLSAGQWHELMRHLWWNVGGIGCFVAAVLLWVGGSNRFRRDFHWPLLLLGIIGMACLTIGAWHGGEMVYGDALAVNPPARSAIAAASSRPAEAASATSDDKDNGTGDTWSDPLQWHLLLAGLTLAMAVGALGLSWRALGECRLARDKNQADDEISWTPDERIIHVLKDEGADLAPRVSHPPARFWLLTALLGLCTAAVGLLIMDMWSWPQLRAFWLSHHRELGHAAGGASIIVLSILLALATRLARRQGWLLGLLSLLLILAMAAQIWLGVLLAFDSMSGPVWRFNPPQSSAAQVASITPHPPS